MTRAGRRVAATVVGLVLLATAGCGEPSIEDYCEQLREDRDELAEIVASGDPALLLGNLDLLRELRDTSPRDVRDEWDTFLDALAGLDRALEEAGADPGDFEEGQAPAGLSQEDQEAVRTAAERVQAPDVVDAANGIETQARDVCQVNLGL